MAIGKIEDSIFSGLKLLTPMLLIRPSSTHFSKAAHVSSKGGTTLGPGFTDVGLHSNWGLVSFKSHAMWSAVSTDISWNRVYVAVCRRNIVLHVVHCKLHRNGLLSPPTLIQQLQVSAMSYMQLVHNQRGFRPNTCGLLPTCLAECNPG